MTKPVRIYGVSSGSYSDYTVHAMFETELQAQAHAADIDDDGRVEEFMFYPKGTKPEMVTLYSASVQSLDDDARVHYSRRVADYEGEVKTYRRPKVSVSGNGQRVYATALTAEAAIKSVADKVAQLRAERAGIA